MPRAIRNSQASGERAVDLGLMAPADEEIHGMEVAQPERRELVHLLSRKTTVEGDIRFRYKNVNGDQGEWLEHRDGSFTHNKPDGSQLYVHQNNAWRCETSATGHSRRFQGDNGGIKEEWKPFWFKITCSFPNSYGNLAYRYSSSGGRGFFYINRDGGLYFKGPAGLASYYSYDRGDATFIRDIAADGGRNSRWLPNEGHIPHPRAHLTRLLGLAV
ncbi:hypothetical protein EIP91_011771 [Steccherinum ochraceum]|uniref:Uncharacterized protein n=1 Tax=Steccherinum ochraceum TaxID=92696 RepID=A0A4R0RHJ0_9APHY|nr:hypothetical protein EIP91_011771 [Steccherinum ochraceum]